MFRQESLYLVEEVWKDVFHQGKSTTLSWVNLVHGE